MTVFIKLTVNIKTKYKQKHLKSPQKVATTKNGLELLPIPQKIQTFSSISLLIPIITLQTIDK